MAPLRILIAAETYPPDVNGAARFAARLATGMAGRGHEVHVVAPSPTGARMLEVRDGVVVHGLRSHRWYRHEAFRVCLPRAALVHTAALVAQIAPDVVHTNGHLSVGRGVVRAARRLRTPVVATNHLVPENLVGYAPLPRRLHRLYDEWAWRDLGRVFGRAATVTAPTPRAVELLVRRAGLVDAVPVSCGIDAEPYRALPRVPADVPTVLFVGRLDQEKRVDELIRAFAGLPPGVPGRLEIIGDGACRAGWAALAAGLGLGERVVFRGFVGDDELLAAYARADVFCMPGTAELQSLVTLEAVAAGLPVVAADAMALPHLVRHGRNGWLYRPGNVDELSSRLASLLVDGRLRRRMGAAGREIVSGHALGATLDTFEGIYERVLGRATPSATSSPFAAA